MRYLDYIRTIYGEKLRTPTSNSQLANLISEITRMKEAKQK